MYDRDISEDDFPKIKKLSLNKDIVKALGDKIVERLTRIAINNDINITLPQAVLVPDISVITQSSHEDYFKINQSKLMMSLSGLNNKKSQPIYEFLNKDGEFTLKNHLENIKLTISQDESILSQKAFNMKSNDKNKKSLNKSFDNSTTSLPVRKNTTASTSPWRNPRNVDESFVSKSSTKSKKVNNKVNRTFTNVESNPRQGSEIYSSLVSNLNVSKYFETDLIGRITEAESKKENEPEESKSATIISVLNKSKTQSRFVKTNTKSNFNFKPKTNTKIFKSTQRQAQGLNKSPTKTNKIPTIDYRVDLRQLVEQYKKKN